ncbi:Bug family tripartite tricarboxylate transporter substrate binding protein [Azotobacter beijerinckii]|uniref:Tricarboxylic transport membrane protein n=1 Tax=Azotobacter beijerinckii TaxID=170623 RepID=A0A1I4DWJ2_9GAMM|nr:tripartite tricarboxylate transporter substrate binding protein [Azotobacter beijerinckii]SFB43503.1 putative tricarboxylic transport membrane protein [Azotobacter beijerinckii]SFK97805.1 putative tricarboxylic transport membrane protein [Azotobacter beijerinckii]
MGPSIRRALLAAAALLLCSAQAAEPVSPQCIVPAAAGGGFDLVCKLARQALQEAGLTRQPLHLSYMPGGVGAVAYNTVVAQRPAEPGTLVAFSSGSLLNLALGKFGRFDETAVRWLAVIGTSYGALAVRADSPYKTLDDLLAALRKDPDSVVIGTSGTVGSQDWMQLALLVRLAGIDPRELHYVALEGGGEIATALAAGHVQVASTDISDSMPHLNSGAIRLLAVFAERRLDKPAMAAIPTAREQGYDVVWPVLRGFYMGPQVSDADYAWWKETFDRLLASEDFARLRDRHELFPFAMTGAELDAHVRQKVARYREMARDFGLIR